MKPEDFIQAYESALGTQDWEEVEPLIHDDASVTFSNGRVYKGKSEIKKAFENNFRSISSEKYSISNIHWVRKSSDTAVYLFDFSWSGYINGQQASGSGRGTSFLIKEDEKWRLLVEHLGPKSL